MGIEMKTSTRGVRQGALSHEQSTPDALNVQLAVVRMGLAAEVGLAAESWSQTHQHEDWNRHKWMTFSKRSLLTISLNFQNSLKNNDEKKSRRMIVGLTITNTKLY